MYLLPTDGLAEDFSKTRIQKTIDDTPTLRNLFSSKSRDGDNTISLKLFSGGYITIHGASTPTKLASKPIRVLLADEVDRFPHMVANEGNPLKLALQRTTNFANHFVNSDC
jgi:phage terminase large subunit GpA-like protein